MRNWVQIQATVGYCEPRWAKVGRGGPWWAVVGHGGSSWAVVGRRGPWWNNILGGSGHKYTRRTY